jgi:hypothetical protein
MAISTQSVLNIHLDLGEFTEKCLAGSLGFGIGFLVGGPSIAIAASVGSVTIIHQRWEGIHHQESAKKTHDLLLKFFSLIVFSAVSFVGAIFFYRSKLFSCAEALNSHACKVDFWLEKLSWVTCLVFSSLAISTYQKNRPKQK